MLARRAFAACLAAAGLGAQGGADAANPPENFLLGRNGWVPNNEHLPVLFYRAVLTSSDGDPAALHERVFAANGWSPRWRNGVYDFHHYHSTAHEVLGFSAGSARLILGGPGGREVTVRAGDVILLPAGTGHCRLEASDDFLVVGAYPPDQHWDICQEEPTSEAIARMAHLPFPSTDPIGTGSLPCLWTKA